MCGEEQRRRHRQPAGEAPSRYLERVQGVCLSYLEISTEFELVVFPYFELSTEFGLCLCSYFEVVNLCLFYVYVLVVYSCHSTLD